MKILIPTSPIPSHPSTAILDETIANIRKYTDDQIILMVDGVHESLKDRTEAYTQYMEAVSRNYINGKYGKFLIVRFSVHTHQAGMTKYVLEKYVDDDEVIMFCEHDTSLIGDIPFKDICDIVFASPTVNYIRFNIFDRILPEHEYLMIGELPEFKGVKLTRTIQWSQRPHIAKSSWYIKLLKDHFPDDRKTMIEDVMHSVVQVAYSENGIDFGLTIYTPEGNQLRSYHSDGRGQDEKIIEG